ncbi:MAG: cell envelope integrity protein CreD [Treponema sp.]|jgi:inner membrane protein|nr:cell envelope integrity protein CreD [Treponema sp.]
MERIKTLAGSRGFKVFLLLVLILLFLIPTGMVQSLIWERKERSLEVEEDILRSWGDEFVVQGPVLRIPCREREEIKTKTGREEEVKILEKDFYLWIVPEELQGTAALGTETKRRGIFSVPLFSGTIRLNGSFDPAVIAGELAPNQRALPEKAELVIALASQRGIRGVTAAAWNGENLEFVPGDLGFAASQEDDRPVRTGGGIWAAASLAGADAVFDITLSIQGGKSLRMIPLGKDSVFDISADWSAPSFQGAYLPVSHETGGGGFNARWEISRLSRNIPLAWKEGASQGGASAENFSMGENSFGVNFFKALDHYDVNTRAVKYALLFIIIPFLSFFLFEIFLRRDIHPVQYLLAGLGNVVFYLLLLSFSEHMPFTGAYCISALAVIVMMSLYSRSLLGSKGKSWIMGFIMVLCYSFLYFTLQSEDWALMMGSIGAFSVLALVMFLTRKFDWRGKRDEVLPAPTPDAGLSLP